MTARKRNRKKRSERRFIKTLLLLFFLLIPLNSFLNFSRSTLISKPLTIPKVSRIHLPDGLRISPFYPNVLGAEVIDPKDIAKYVNVERKKVGSSPLRLNTTLMKAAQMRADVILKHQNFSHQDPFENIELGTVLPKLGYNFIYASENIGMGGSSGEDFVGGFMNSFYHKENLLNPTLTETGAAVVTGPYDKYYVNIAVQIFAIPGGRKEYLGYSEEEKEKYGKILAQTRFTLNPVVWQINRFLHKNDFTEDKYMQLKKQEIILNQLYTKMDEEKPFEDKDVAMVLEYNNLI